MSQTSRIHSYLVIISFPKPGDILWHNSCLPWNSVYLFNYKHSQTWLSSTDACLDSFIKAIVILVYWLQGHPSLYGPWVYQHILSACWLALWDAHSAQKTHVEYWSRLQTAWLNTINMPNLGHQILTVTSHKKLPPLQGSFYWNFSWHPVLTTMSPSLLREL